ncbi:unnamed protein product [Rhizophagus irregularis]|nr:unnamed protein product [Rhizophagus irregularis]
MSARVLKKEKTSVDKELTKKQAERSELLPEETGLYDSCSSTSDLSSKPNLEEDIESEYYDFRKRHKLFIHGKMQFIKLMPEEILKRIFRKLQSLQ